MALKDYEGPANDGGIFKHLVGETIKASGRDIGGEIYLIMESGYAFAIGKSGSFWIEKPEKVASVIERWKADLNDRLTEMRLLMGKEFGPVNE